VSDDYFTISQSVTADGPAGEVTTLHLAGEFDIGARDELHDELINTVHAAGDSVVVDLRQVTFIDSEAIGALLDGYGAAQHSGVSFRLANACGVVHRVMQVSGLLFLFDQHPPAPVADAAPQCPAPIQLRDAGTGRGRQ
jgi:anti-sigma B factor antagonist